MLFGHAVCQARLAQRTSTIAGILGHQGESDCAEDLYPVYEQKLADLICAFRNALDLHDVLFLLSGLGDFLPECDSVYGRYIEINAALQHFAATMSMTGYVHATGLTSNPDKLHFNTKSLRKFGERYYERFKSLENPNKCFFEKPDPDRAYRTDLEEI